MKIKYSGVIRLLGIVLSLFCAPGHTAVAGVSGTISNILAHDQLFGKCMIRSTTFAPTNNCPAEWVSLDCSGEFGSKADSSRLLDISQMAFALGTSIYVVIDDAKKHNGFCVAARVELTK